MILWTGWILNKEIQIIRKSFLFIYSFYSPNQLLVDAIKNKNIICYKWKIFHNYVTSHYKKISVLLSPGSVLYFFMSKRCFYKEICSLVSSLEIVNWVLIRTCINRKEKLLRNQFRWVKFLKTKNFVFGKRFLYAPLKKGLDFNFWFENGKNMLLSQFFLKRFNY